MTIMINCECGNKMIATVPPQKYMQFRDELDHHRFHYNGSKVKDEKLKEICIVCDKCKNSIILGMD